ncbi:eIF2A-related protein [Ktedonobacter racemifer]|uniref:Transcriptional regulator, XRE family n=1 Tax=Ktedonobacter racemifer DSM 44963 TaxID=485913 RepID=D6TK87_KTERA|nr:NB-ARC domain-containing protein [Ktedonobacter racemifer]EFH86187.1 transcriptional regulator, XRE family [Ktedonobacter racemifer DSM 44963]
MTRYSYRERDYTFGQAMLKLRNSISLTQAALADLLGVSRRAVGEWEAGNTYPKAPHLQHFVELCVQQHVFEPGHEEEEIRALWKMAHQRVWLDEAWLSTLLTRPPVPPHPITQISDTAIVEVSSASTPQLSPQVERPVIPAFAKPVAFSHVDWVGALDVSHFAGREVEVVKLTQWIVQERCRLIAILGMGGIGKSTLVSLLGQRLASQFEAVLWCSVRDAPSCEELVADCISFFSETPPTAFPSSLEQRINQLVARLQARRCLLVLDNLETLLVSGNLESGYLPGYEGYGRLVGRLAESEHQSCVLLTSREKPREIEPLEGARGHVRSLRLQGLDEQAAHELLADKELNGTFSAWQHLVASYGGNPLALKIVAQGVSDLFAGDIDRFLEEGELVFNGVRAVLRQQVGRLSMLEHLLLTWLAVLREWTSLDTLAQVLHPRIPRAPLLEALEALRRRSLLERGQQANFSLQSMVMEYLTDELCEYLAEEIMQGTPQQLRRVALSQARAQDYVREIQVRLLVRPLIERLRAELVSDAQIEAHLLRLLEQFRAEDAAVQGYGPANVISLLKDLRGHLRGLNLSRLAIRGAYLQDVEMQDACLRGALLQESTFSEHPDVIDVVAISPTGQYWAAAGYQGKVRLWRDAGRVLHRVWQAHTNVIETLTFSPNGRLLVSGAWDDTIKLWDVESGKLLWTGVQHGNVNCVTFTPDGRLLTSGGGDARIQLWDTQSGTVIQQITNQGGTVCWLDWSPDGTQLATGCADGNIWLWQPGVSEPENHVHQLSGHTHWVTGLAFAPNGIQLASASFDGTVKLWDLERLECIQTFSGHTDRVIRVVWSPDGRTVASAGFDKTIWLWDTQEQRARAVLREHTAAIFSLAFTPDSRTLLSGSSDGTIRAWDVERGQCLHVIGGYVASLYDVDWNPDGKQLFTAGADTLVTIWDRASGAPSGILRGHRWTVFGIAASPDGQLLVSTGHDNHMALWEVGNDVPLHLLRPPDGADTIFYKVMWSPDGHFLACGTYMHGAQVWDVTTLTRRWVAQASSNLIRDVAWSPDGMWVAGGSDDGSVSIWAAADGSQRLQRRHAGAIFCVAWSLDGTWLACGGGGREGGEVLIYETQSGELLRTLVSHPGLVYAVAWSPGGDMLISAGSDGKLRWWEVASGQCVRVQEAHHGMVETLKVSPDGRMLASCGHDGVLLVWDLHSGERLQTLRRDRPYERLDITGTHGLSDAQKASLCSLGAFEETAKINSVLRGEKVQE